MKRQKHLLIFCSSDLYHCIHKKNSLCNKNWRIQFTLSLSMNQFNAIFFEKVKKIFSLISHRCFIFWYTSTCLHELFSWSQLVLANEHVNKVAFSRAFDSWNPRIMFPPFLPYRCFFLALDISPVLLSFPPFSRLLILAITHQPMGKILHILIYDLMQFPNNHSKCP